MFEIFKTILMLSLLGGGITALLLLLKPITAKRLSAKWQYYIWLAVIVCMVFPVWKFIPKQDAAKLIPPVTNQMTQQAQLSEIQTDTAIITDTPMEYREIQLAPSKSIRVYDLIGYGWLVGMCIFLIVAFGSYGIFLIRSRKNSVPAEENHVLLEVRNTLKIKRPIKVRLSKKISSPMLVGTIKPTVYLPCKSLDEERLRMIFLHELTHYKRGDLFYKWLSLFVNAVHWFNPLAYLLSANINEACEVSCDMVVTEDMTKEEQNFYIGTILDLMKLEG